MNLTVPLPYGLPGMDSHCRLVYHPDIFPASTNKDLCPHGGEEAGRCRATVVHRDETLENPTAWDRRSTTQRAVGPMGRRAG